MITTPLWTSGCCRVFIVTAGQVVVRGLWVVGCRCAAERTGASACSKLALDFIRMIFRRLAYDVTKAFLNSTIHTQRLRDLSSRSYLPCFICFQFSPAAPIPWFDLSLWIVRGGKGGRGGVRIFPFNLLLKKKRQNKSNNLFSHFLSPITSSLPPPSYLFFSALPPFPFLLL